MRRKTIDSLRLSTVFCFARLAVLAGLLLLFAACGGGRERGFGAAPVTTALAVTKDVPVFVEAIGTVEPNNQVVVKAQVGGKLTRVAIREGQEVRRGDLLFTIDQRPYLAALDGAEANLARDKARLASSREDLRRYEALVKKDYVTRQQYDRAKAEAEAQAATVKADEAAVERARLDLEYCTVRAPIPGVTGSLSVRQGALIKANETQITTLNAIHPVLVAFSVPERELSAVRKQDAKGLTPVTVVPGDGSSGSFEGRLVFIDNAVDEATGAILLKASLPNKDSSLWPGQFVTARLALGTRKNAVVVPSRAVQRGQEGRYVFVVKGDMTVESRPVKSGPEWKGQTVAEEGLKAGERVVTDGQLRLYPGAKVTLVERGRGENGAAP